MGKKDKLFLKIIQAKSDTNIPFKSLCSLLKSIGFNERIRGDHYIFTREDISEIINIQPKGAQAKPYQVKQIRSILINNNLGDF